MQKNMVGSLTIHVSQNAHSSDPYQFDFFAHHVIFGSAYAKLFSSYKDAKITEYLAKSYTVDSGYKNWKFSIRSDVKFSNGDLITPKIIENSLKRIFLLAKKNKSNLPIIRKISEIEKLTSLDSIISGLYSDNESLYFRLSEGEQNLPEILSFGLYGIAHPHDYDKSTLEWKATKPISSGPYYFKELDFTKKHTQFFLRDDFPKDLVLSAGPKSIKVASDASELANLAHILKAGFLEDNYEKNGLQFFGNTSADVSFIYVVKWNDNKDPMSNAQNRRALRYLVEKKLKEKKIKVTRSMFPLIHNGVREVEFKETEDLNIKNFGKKNFLIRKRSNTSRSDVNIIETALFESIESLGGIPKKVDIPVKDIRNHFSGIEYSGDRLSFAFRATGIGNENPRETAEFMLSKEGINIPDPRGVLIKIAQSEPFDMNAFNKELYEDAILWPMIHTSFGYWAKDDLDFSRFNLSLPLSEVHWIGLK